MIEVVNEHPRYRVNKRDLVRLLRKTAEVEKKTIDVVTVVLVTDKHIAKVHRDYLNDPTATDVITFDLSRTDEIGGDIVISLDTATRQAAEYGVSLRQETGRLAVHGFLHLCGMSDKTKVQRERMHQRENVHLIREGWLGKE